jgi:hypothetical protein
MNFTPKELRQLRALNTPAKIQGFLDRVPYHLENTAWSPRRVLAEQTAHCLEGAIFAAAALRVNGFPALILDLEADKDTDHVMAVFRQNGGWGAIASSNYSTCRFRAPIHRTLRELALSYFDGYFNLRGERSLRTFSQPVDLKRFDHKDPSLDWMTTEKPVWFIAEYLLDIPHTPLLTPRMLKSLKDIPRVDKRLFEAGLHGHRKK